MPAGLDPGPVMKQQPIRLFGGRRAGLRVAGAHFDQRDQTRMVERRAVLTPPARDQPQRERQCALIDLESARDPDRHYIIKLHSPEAARQQAQIHEWMRTAQNGSRTGFDASLQRGRNLHQATGIMHLARNEHGTVRTFDRGRA